MRKSEISVLNASSRYSQSAALNDTGDLSLDTEHFSGILCLLFLLSIGFKRIYPRPCFILLKYKAFNTLYFSFFL